MKAIIVAAGRGNRLVPLSDDKPKCMLEVGKETIMQRQLSVLRECGVDDIVVVRGYKKELINYPGIKYYDNIDYENNNILRSLFYAEEEMDGGFVFSYSDIIYTRKVAEGLLGSKYDISLIIDLDWTAQYVGRVKHPVTEAELVQVKDGRIVRIGKDVKPQDSYGEFIGLAKFSKRGARILKVQYHKLSQVYKNRPDKPFQNVPEFQKAYFTDMMQDLTDRGYQVHPVDIRNNWVEIDTDEDLERARKKFGGVR